MAIAKPARPRQQHDGHIPREAALPAAQLNVADVLARISDGFCAIDREWRFTAVNAAAERMYGLPAQELLGKDVWQAFAPLVGTPLYDACRRAMAEGTSASMEYFHAAADAWYDVRIYPSAHGILVFFRDISAAKRVEQELRASEARLRTLVEQLPVVVYVLAADENQTALYFSPSVEDLIGAQPVELMARPGHWLDFVHPDDLERVTAEDQASLASGDLFSVEYRLLRADGAYVWVRDECAPLLDECGQVVAFQGVLLDITERKRVDAELRAALATAQAAHRATSQFLAMMNHELRTPMQAVIGYSDLLLAGPRGSLTSQQAEDVGYIQQGARRMIALIDQMLSLARMEAGHLELAAVPVDLAEILEEVRQDVAPQAALKSLDLCIDVPPALPPLLADPVALRQILLNLVGNAVKFTDRGEIRVSAGAAAGGVAVCVSDTGIGVPGEALPHIFDEFRQVSGGTTRRFGGAGLGLAIARKLAEQHGGHISVESEPGAGSTFTLFLPLTRPASPSLG